MKYVLLLLSCSLLMAADETYTGKWASSQSGSVGTLRMKLTPQPDVSFTLNGEEVKTKVSSSKVTGENFDLEYEFQAEGYKLRSHVKGTIKDDKVKATYETTLLDDGSIVDSGTFEGAAAK